MTNISTHSTTDTVTISYDTTQWISDSITVNLNVDFNKAATLSTK